MVVIYNDVWFFSKKAKSTIKDKSATSKFELRPVGTTRQERYSLKKMRKGRLSFGDLEIVAI